MNNSYYNVSHSRDYYKGKSVEFAGEWTSGVRYFNDEYLNSLVVYTEKDTTGNIIHSALLACKKTHIAAYNSSIPDSTNNQPHLIINDDLGTIGIEPNDYWIFISGSLTGTPGIPGKSTEVVNTYLEAVALANENNISKIVFVKEEKGIYIITDIGELKKIISTSDLLELAENKVDKELGKGLSTNDFSNTEKAKLKGIEDNAQRNIIEEIDLNGVKIDPIDKTISINTVGSINGQTGDITLRDNSETAWDVNLHIEDHQIQGKVVTPKSVGSETTPVYFNENREITPINIDDEVTKNSNKLVTSGAIYRSLDLKQNQLIPGDNITIQNNVISAKSELNLAKYAKIEDVEKKLSTKQDTLIPDNGIKIEENKISVTAITESEEQPNTSIWINPEENTEVVLSYNRSQIDALLNTKQDTLVPGSGIIIDGNVISSIGGGSGGGSIDLSTYAKKADVETALAEKQNVISDLANIREGAEKGKTALQSFTETDPVYTADKPNLATKAELNTKQNTISDLDIIRNGANKGSTALQPIQSITYAELVALRDSSSLVAGMQYRITDYDFTTTEEDTDSAHMLFDIIVTADSESILNENARAIHHQYGSNKETVTGAIKLYKTDMSNQEYSSKVDTQDYFLLAGKMDVNGVIYYRYDKYEFVNNDYVNVRRYILLETIDLDSLGVRLDNPLYPVGEGTYEEDGTYMSHYDDAIVAYENGTVTVDSVHPLSSRDMTSWELKYTLENTKHSSTDGKGTILWMRDEYRNECNYDFINALYRVYEITACTATLDLLGAYGIKISSSDVTYGANSRLVPTFGVNSHDNIIKYDGLAKIVFGNNCYFNTFESNCHSNTFGNDCRLNTFGNDFIWNIFGNLCYHNILGNNCSLNIFGNNYYCNTLENNCRSNTFGNNCCYNTLENDCRSNTFGNECSYNTLKNSCHSNTFGNNCSSNTFENNCSYNTLGNDCSLNTFGNNCNYIKFASINSATTKYNYYQYNNFGDGCMCILFKGAETASLSTQVQNYNFAQGLQGTSSAYLTIDGVRSRAYETKVAKNSSGKLKIYCEADLIQ